MFDVPPPLQSRGMAAYKKTWDLFFAYHQPGQAFDVEELQICAGDIVVFAVAIMLSLLIFIGEAVRDAFDPRKTFR